MRNRWLWAAAFSTSCLLPRVAHADAPLDARLLNELRAEATDQVDAWTAASALSNTDPAKGLEALVAVGDKTTHFSAAHRRACTIALRLELRDRARGLCETAVARERSSWNVASLAIVLASRTATTTALDTTKAQALIREALAMPDADAYTKALSCEVLSYRDLVKADECARDISESTKDEKRLALGVVLTAAMRDKNFEYADATAATLRRLFPDDDGVWRASASVGLEKNDPKLVRMAAVRLREISPRPGEGWAFAAIASAMEGNLSQARDDADRAARAGLPAEQVASLRSAIDASESPLMKWGKRLGVLLGSWLVALGLLWVAGEFLSRRVLQEIASAGDRTVEPSLTERRLRRAYGHVLRLASAFYYVSLPLVALLVVGSFGAVVLFFLAIGIIPIKLLIIGGFLALASVAAMVGSLTKVRDEADPGESLPLAEHPRLQEALRQVASEVGTPPVDRVFLTPGTDLAVFERGSVSAALRSRLERCLVLGVGVLEGLDENAFRAILAHEHGHFAHGDTAGGELALSVRLFLLRTALGMAEAGAATAFNPAWRFVEGYYRLFVRISHGASRLQEVQADRFAAACYGPAAFERGLTHVISRDVFFHANADALVAECAKQTTIFKNLYQQSPREGLAESKLQGAVAESLAREPSAYDSHPAPKERFALVKNVVQKPRKRDDVIPDDALAWDLFDRREALELLMTEQIRIVLAERGVQLPKDATGVKEASAEPVEPAEAPKKKKKRKKADEATAAETDVPGATDETPSTTPEA